MIKKPLWILTYASIGLIFTTGVTLIAVSSLANNSNTTNETSISKVTISKDKENILRLEITGNNLYQIDTKDITINKIESQGSSQNTIKIEGWKFLNQTKNQLIYINDSNTSNVNVGDTIYMFITLKDERKLFFNIKVI